LRRVDGRAGLQLALEILLHRRSRSDGHAALVIDDLSIDLLGRAENRQTRTSVGGFADRTAHTSLAAIFSAFLVSHDASSLLLLAFLAEDEFPGILDALALIGLGATILADLGGGLPDLLLVGTRHHDLRGLGRDDRHPGRDLVVDVV